MSAAPTNGDFRESSTPPNSAEDSLTALRQLLLGPEQRQLQHLQERLDNLVLQPDQVGQVLPEAIRQRTERNRDLTEALLPTIKEAIQTSVHHNPRILVEALFPLMGPAIRRALAHRLRGLLMSFNQALTVSLSLRGVRWRLEALRTGRPFAEVVLLRTLRYRVEQVFLIHRTTGLLLQHVVADAVTVQDSEIVSGMLTAIRAFVEDAFTVHADDTLETIQVGELSVCIEQGPYALLVAVVRGSAPAALKTVLEDALAHLHTEYHAALLAFQGDATPFAGARSHLETCLQAHDDTSQRRSPLLIWIVCVALLGGVGLWGMSAIWAHQRWARYLEHLQAEPGIVVVSAGKRRGRYVVVGLRDPFAVDPAQLLPLAGLSSTQVQGHWEAYLALEPAMVLARARALLRPPDTVQLALDHSVLEATGAAWHAWIRHAQQLASAIPGVTRFRADRLVDLTQREVTTLTEEIEGYVLLFVKDTALLASGQEVMLHRLRDALQALLEAAQQVGTGLHLQVIGHADATGSEGRNLQLSRQRAEHVVATLLSHNLPGALVTTAGVGSQETLHEETSEEMRALNRRVTFRITLSEPPRR